MSYPHGVVILTLAAVVVLGGGFPPPGGSFVTPALTDGSRRSILRLVGSGEQELPDAAVDLNATDFDAFLGASPARFAVAEFFAHWCPACRNYKPQYEKVARLFNGPDAVHPGIIVMTRVDCAMKMNAKLCSRFSVSHYPMLFWGPPLKFASSLWEPNQEKNEIKPIDDGRTADRLLNWINKQLGSTFSLEDEKYENENTLAYNASDPEEIFRAVYDIEEATTRAFDIIIEHKMIKSETRAPLIKFLQLLVAHHPSKRCRRGSSEILVNFDDLWPLDLLALNPSETVTAHEKDALKSFQICGKEVPRGYWIFCRGSKKDTRGFSCGLWILLHSLSVRIADGESHSTFGAMCDFIHNFFICEECRQHFYEMCSRVSVPFNTTRDLSLWLWSTHNKVNERLMKEEKSLRTGDPKFPKVIWPPKQLCPTCYKSLTRQGNNTVEVDWNKVEVDWNKDEVFNFLVKYYGKILISSYKETSLSSKVSSETVIDDISASKNAVPIGAAFAIALASCAFGALACFWRAQQKNRKKLRKRAGAES